MSELLYSIGQSDRASRTFFREYCTTVDCSTGSGLSRGFIHMRVYFRIVVRRERVRLSELVYSVEQQDPILSTAGGGGASWPLGWPCMLGTPPGFGSPRHPGILSLHLFFAPFLCTFSATLQLLHLVFAVVGRAPEVPVGRDVVVGLRQHLVAVVAPEALLVVGQPAGADTVVLVHLHEVGPESGTTPPPRTCAIQHKAASFSGGLGAGASSVMSATWHAVVAVAGRERRRAGQIDVEGIAPSCRISRTPLCPVQGVDLAQQRRIASTNQHPTRMVLNRAEESVSRGACGAAAQGWERTARRGQR